MEQSESGSPIYRHENREREFEFAIGDSENIDRITQHIDAHVGPVATVFHEVISDLVHVDIHIVEPRPGRNCYTLVTSGRIFELEILGVVDLSAARLADVAGGMEG